MALSKRTRFEVFKRDKFTCQYCGRTPPVVILHCDHVIPSSQGGLDDEENLITSCADCNLGKSDVSLDSMPSSLSEKAELIQERRDQILEYEKLLKRETRRRSKSIGEVAETFELNFPDRHLTERFKRVSVGLFLKHFTAAELCEFMDVACAKFSNDADRAVKYFCGICWKRIKDADGGRE